MEKYYWLCMFLQGIANGQINANIAKADFYGDPEFVTFSCWPDRFTDEQFMSTTIPALSCNVTFYGTISYNTSTFWRVSAIDKYGNEVNMLEDNDTMENIYKKSKGSMIEHAMESGGKCFNQTTLYPLHGSYKIEKCRLEVGSEIPLISKVFRLIMQFSDNTKQLCGFDMRLEMDDTSALRAKRPSKAQKIRRRQG